MNSEQAHVPSAAPPPLGVGAEYAVQLERYPRAPVMPDVRRLSVVSNLRSVAAIAFQWAVIALCFYWVVMWPHWWSFLLAGVIIASRLQALGVLLHDGVHWLLFTNRTVNDVACDLLVAFPLGMSTTLYRDTHFKHHRFTNTDQDHDIVIQRQDAEWYDWPKTWTGCVGVIIKSVLGLNMNRSWQTLKHWSPAANFFKPLSPAYPLRARVMFVLSSIGIIGLAVAGLINEPRIMLSIVFVFAVPGVTLLNLINRVRGTAEHVRTPGTNELNSTRTVIPALWERFFISPFGVNYHLEHHLFPSVPGRNLSQLHRLLMQDERFRERAHVTVTYVGMFLELMSAPTAQLPATVATPHVESERR